MTDANGNATLAAMDPGSTARPASSYLDKTWGIIVESDGNTTTAYTTVMLLAAPSPGTTLSAGPSSGPQLANTGVDAGGLGAMAVGLLLTGGLSLAVGRRRS